jgi:hAT family C-terminal dimerisation region
MLNDAVGSKRQIVRYIKHHAELQPLSFTTQDWTWMGQICAVLRRFDEFTRIVSQSEPQVSLSLAIYYELGDLLQEVSDREGQFASCDQDIVDAVEAGMEKYKKYYKLMDESNTYYTATMLDPRFKAKWMKKHLDPEDANIIIQEVKRQLHIQYPKPIEPWVIESEDITNFTIRQQPLRSRMLRAIEEDEELMSDIDRYFNTDVVKMTSISSSLDTEVVNRTMSDFSWLCSWWKAHAFEFPRMAAAARDCLAIPAAEVSVERLFSGGRDMLGLRRHSMSAETMRVLVLLKDMYREKP